MPLIKRPQGREREGEGGRERGGGAEQIEGRGGGE
jgi:hypothetical protein